MSKKQKTSPKKQEKEDDSTLKLAYSYRKRCDLYGIVPNPVIKAELDKVTQNGKNINGKLEMLHCAEEIGSMQVRAFLEAASDLHYQHLKKVRIWKGAIGDEGVRFVAKYLTTNYSLELIDLLDNGITPLGCQFIGKAMTSPLCNVKHLKLDDNLILSAGLKNLVIGLRQNNTIDKLSLKYCGIDGEGAKYIQQIIANINTNLRSLKLQGNHFGNEAIYQILRAVQHCDSLQKLNIADTGIQLLDYKPQRQSLVEHIANHLIHIMKTNNKILKYDIRFNPMHSEIAEQLLKSVELNLTIRKIQFANNVNYNLRDALDTILRKRNKTKVKKSKKPKK